VTRSKAEQYWQLARDMSLGRRKLREPLPEGLNARVYRLEDTISYFYKLLREPLPEGLNARVDRLDADTISYFYKLINELRVRVSTLEKKLERLHL
jgi:hypothetical protein